MLDGLNEAQREAVLHGEGPLLVVAGAGTGKTTTLAHRVAQLISRGVPPERILLLTFARRAAAELLRRVDGLLGRASVDRPASSRVWGGTFHSVATRLLRQHGARIGLHPGFTIHDRGDSEDLLEVLRAELELGRGKRRFPRKATCLDIYSRCVNARSPLDAVLARGFPWCTEQMRRAEAALPHLRGPQGRAAGAGLRRPSPLLPRARWDGCGRPGRPRAVRPRAGGRVPGHQRAAGRAPRPAPPGRERPHGGGRRCAVDLLVPGGAR